MGLRSFLLIALSLVLVFDVVAGGNREAAPDDGVTQLEFWTFGEQHLDFFEDMAEVWNEENPDNQIELIGTVYPFAEMHDNLLIALQSGVGVPDIVDIEVARFPTFLRGAIQLLPLDDYITDVRDDIVESRLQIYSANGQVYGLPFHVGATVMYYNEELTRQAGVDIDEIVTWDDFVEAGKIVREELGIPMTTLEFTGQWSLWPMVAQRRTDFVTSDGAVNIDSDIIIDTLEFQRAMVHDHGVAELAPGGDHHAEEYYGFMNDGGAAAIMMPFWYMIRFTDYMEDLAGKIAIRPLPIFDEGDYRSAGMGGTGTAVPTQGDHAELAAEFVAFAKAGEEGNIRLWEDLGFDPPRFSVWDDPRMQAENRFTDYFTNGTGIFDTILPLTGEIYPIRLTEDSPEILTLINDEVLVQVLQNQSATAREALESAANQIR